MPTVIKIYAHAEDGTTREARLSAEEFAIVRHALDSHRYFQLADDGHREAGYVRMPGAADPSDAAEIAAVNAIEERLAGLVSEDAGAVRVVSDDDIGEALAGLAAHAMTLPSPARKPVERVVEEWCAS